MHDRCDTGYSTVTARSEYTKPYMTPYETRNLCAKFSQFHVSNVVKGLGVHVHEFRFAITARRTATGPLLHRSRNQWMTKMQWTPMWTPRGWIIKTMNYELRGTNKVPQTP